MFRSFEISTVIFSLQYLFPAVCDKPCCYFFGADSSIASSKRDFTQLTDEHVFTKYIKTEGLNFSIFRLLYLFLIGNTLFKLI